MLVGKLVGPCALLVVSSCAHNVAQDAATGADGKPKGAKEIKLDNGEGKSNGIVTYPGGDRVDWKVVDLPDKKRGTLEVNLTWQPPRPGLQLAFDVFDEWNTPIISSSKTNKKHSKGRIKSATVENAKGKYFIRVYAVNRGDAGKYKLKVEFKESAAAIAFDAAKIEIPDPPRLAAVPEIEAACDPFNFDPKIPACKQVCPEAGAPPGWPACKGKCPTPPDINIEACHATMPCPNPPDRRVKACPASKWPKCVDIKNPNPNIPNCETAKADPVTGKILHPEVQGSDVLITIGVGTDQGVQKGWKGHVLRGDTDSYLDGGDVAVIRVGKRETLGRVHLTVDQINQNQRVKLTPP